jgi:hypothetical protein
MVTSPFHATQFDPLNFEASASINGKGVLVMLCLSGAIIEFTLLIQILLGGAHNLMKNMNSKLSVNEVC